MLKKCPWRSWLLFGDNIDCNYNRGTPASQTQYKKVVVLQYRIWRCIIWNVLGYLNIWKNNLKFNSTFIKIIKLFFSDYWLMDAWPIQCTGNEWKEKKFGANVHQLMLGKLNKFYSLQFILKGQYAQIWLFK